MSEKVNEKYKDRIFTFIFGRNENKKWTLSLYNAINNTQYTDDDDIEITTMSDTVYMGMKNDVSCIVSDTISLYEQQSTYNPNMPVRQLMYLGRQYDRYIEETGKNIYSSKQLHLPVPKLVTFYNGPYDVEDKLLKLSDSFPDRAGESDVQVNVRLINISRRKNMALLNKCNPLNEYSWFVETVREKKKTLNIAIEAAIDLTIDEMPKNYEIRRFLMQNRAEVKNMCLTEYNEAETLEKFKKEYIEEGREEGIKEGMARAMDSLVRDGLLSESDAARRLNISLEEYRNLV